MDNIIAKPVTEKTNTKPTRKFDYYGFIIPSEYVYKYLDEVTGNMFFDTYNHSCRHCVCFDEFVGCECAFDSRAAECELLEEYRDNDEFATKIFDLYTEEVVFDLEYDTPEMDAFIEKVNTTIERARPHLERAGIKVPAMME